VVAAATAAVDAVWLIKATVIMLFTQFTNTARPKHQNNQLHFDQLQHIVTLNRDKFGIGSEFGTIQCPE